MTFVSEHEVILRGGVFLFVLLLLLAIERLRPRRRKKTQRLTRWPANFGLVVIDALLVRLIAPGITIAVALLAVGQHWGLLNWISLPPLISIALAVIALDACIYWQHRIMHRLPVLWRLHRVHHTDIEFDVSTALRFHPLEILFSLLIKAVLVIALGVPVVAIIVFEILLNASAMFNHANIKLPSGWDRVLRWFIVTPDMHRIHHSTRVAQTNSNYGFCMSLWDRLFGSYCQTPPDSHEDMKIGLEAFRGTRDQSILQLLMQPFRTQ